MFLSKNAQQAVPTVCILLDCLEQSDFSKVNPNFCENLRDHVCSCKPINPVLTQTAECQQDSQCQRGERLLFTETLFLLEFPS